MFCGHFEIKGNVVMNCDHVSCQLFTVISEYRELTYPSFFFMCSSNTFEQYSHCIRLMSRDLIPSFCLLFFSHSGTVKVSSSEEGEEARD